MISEITIENYKSIDKLVLPLGRVNVFIGENGAGKSNILEAISLAGAAASEKLDNEFLTSRGIRVTNPKFMRPAFLDSAALDPIQVTVKNDANRTVNISLFNDNSTYAKWVSFTRGNFEFPSDLIKSFIPSYLNVDDTAERKKRQQSANELTKLFTKVIADMESDGPVPGNTQQTISIEPENSAYHLMQMLGRASLRNSVAGSALANFVIYSPENSALRSFEKEGQIEPLGINGEGLLKLLHFYTMQDEKEGLDQVKLSLKALDWFDNFDASAVNSESSLVIKDRYLAKNISDFDHKSANEGFFFLLFYFMLFNSELTPPFFAIDNIDASLNPKLCRKLVIELVKISKSKNKQTILTTHNPAVLDGLNLDDEEQRLFVISRSRDGRTKIKRVFKPKTSPDSKTPLNLSELFLRGLLGGLPKGF